jgi:hypothetical protein
MTFETVVAECLQSRTNWKTLARSEHYWFWPGAESDSSAGSKMARALAGLIPAKPIPCKCGPGWQGTEMQINQLGRREFITLLGVVRFDDARQGDAALER